MKIVSFNVNGLRSIISKDKSGTRGTDNENVLESLVREHDVDILCLQETKCPDTTETRLSFEFSKIKSATRKGYSGVAVYSKIMPLYVHDDFDDDTEGRVMCLEFRKFFLINVYVPNSKPDLSRLEYRTNTWEPRMRSYINTLQLRKPVVVVGDLNVAHTELDIHTNKGHVRSHGYTLEERTAFSKLLEECKLVDSFRQLHPTTKEFSWFSPFANSRSNNKGWRIDYSLVSSKIAKQVVQSDILGDFFGSDHLPVILDIDVK